MLSNFFKLNEPSVAVSSEEDLLDLLMSSDYIKGVLYSPGTFSPPTPKNRIIGKTFENVSFSKTSLYHVTFRNCIFRDCLFIASQIKDCEFHDCTFDHCNTHKINIVNTYVDPEKFSRMLDPEKHANIGVHLFQQLLRNASNTQQRQFRDSAEFHFRNWQRHQWRYDYRTGKIRIWEFLRKWTPEWSYFLIAGYGLRSKFFLIWTIGFLSVVVFVNHLCGPKLEISTSGNSIPDTTLIQSIYFSLVTITTLGYGDFVPTSQLGMGIVTVEAVLGILWIGILAAIIIRRVVR